MNFRLFVSAWTMNGDGLVEGVRYCSAGSFGVVADGREAVASRLAMAITLADMGRVSCEAARDENHQMVGIKMGFSNDQTYNIFLLVLLGLFTLAV